MRMVPRQLRRSDFPSSVPYYGGRLTPQVIADLQRPPARTLPPPSAPAPIPPDRSKQLAELDELLAQGVVTAAEHDELRRRIVGGS